MYTGKKIKNSIAITGEINLRGEVTKIGGLEEKLHGAKKAGVKLALIPEENMDDLEKIKERDNRLLDRSFEVRSVNNIKDVLKIVFV
jgi:ATP-dependent Lon protease